MLQQDVQRMMNGFVDALQLSTALERAEAIRVLVDKGMRLGIAINLPPSDSKTVDITLAALDLLGQLLRNTNRN